MKAQAISFIGTDKVMEVRFLPWPDWNSRYPATIQELAPEAGLEPATRRLTAGCSTIELLWMPQRGAIYRGGL